MNIASPGTETAIFVVFMLFVGFCMLLCVWVVPESDDAAEFYTANRSLSPRRNALAIAGDYVTAITFLATTAVVAAAGYDGILIACGTVMSLLLVMVLFAEPLRNLGGYTLGETFSRRIPGRQVRAAAALVTVLVCLPFLVVQLSAISSVLVYLLGFGGRSATMLCVTIVGVLMISYAAMGGMRGTGVIQIIKVALLSVTVSALALLTLARVDWNIGTLLSVAERGSGRSAAFLGPGLEFGSGFEGRLDDFSFLTAIVFGAACTPHVIMRLFASRNAREARTSMRLAVGITGLLCALIAVLGLGVAALVGAAGVKAADPSGLSDVLLLSHQLNGGGVLVVLTARAIFATQLAAVAGVTLAAGSSLAHDVMTRIRRRRPAAEGGEVTAARLGIVGVGVLGIALALLVQQWNAIAIAGLGVDLAASAIFPALVYCVAWPGFTRAGLLSCLYGACAAVLVLTAFSPAVSGLPTSLFPHRSFDWFPLWNPGLITVPLGFALGWIGSRLGPRLSPADFRAFESQSVTGVPVSH